MRWDIIKALLNNMCKSLFIFIHIDIASVIQKGQCFSELLIFTEILPMNIQPNLHHGYVQLYAEQHYKRNKLLVSHDMPCSVKVQTVYSIQYFGLVLKLCLNIDFFKFFDFFPNFWLFPKFSTFFIIVNFFYIYYFFKTMLFMKIF